MDKILEIKSFFELWMLQVLHDKVSHKQIMNKNLLYKLIMKFFGSKANYVKKYILTTDFYDRLIFSGVITTNSPELFDRNKLFDILDKGKFILKDCPGLTGVRVDTGIPITSKSKVLYRGF